MYKLATLANSEHLKLELSNPKNWPFLPRQLHTFKWYINPKFNQFWPFFCFEQLKDFVLENHARFHNNGLLQFFFIFKYLVYFFGLNATSVTLELPSYGITFSAKNGVESDFKSTGLKTISSHLNRTIAMTIMRIIDHSLRPSRWKNASRSLNITCQLKTAVTHIRTHSKCYVRTTGLTSSNNAIEKLWIKKWSTIMIFWGQTRSSLYQLYVLRNFS